MTTDKTAAPEWIDVAFADGFGWSTYAAHEGDKTRFIRADLCASGQQVRALVWDEYAPGCFFGKSECGDYSVAPSASAFHEGEIRLSDVEGNFSYFASPEAAKAAAQADYESRILAALMPAPQPEGQDALKISPEYQALFDEVKQRAQPEGRDNPSGMVCAACRSVGMWHCSDPENCGGMKPMRSACTCNEPWCKACASAPTPATPTAQEAVPVGWITQPYPGVKWSFSFHAPKTLPEGWIARPLYAHPPQPRETVAELLEEARSGLCAYTGGPDGACSETVKRIDAALRALKGSDK